MIVTRLEVSGFRNLRGHCEFDPNLNIFHGDNAQGKTGWLEAIYVLGNTRSFRTGQIRDIIQFDSSDALLTGDVECSSVSRRLQVSINGISRQLLVNGKLESLVRYLTNLDVLVFSLEEMNVVRGDPSNRRRYLDRAIATVTPSYLNTLTRYNHIVRQKNRLLATAGESARPEAYRDQIEAWNAQQAEAGAQVHWARSGYVDELNRVLEQSDRGRAIFAAERINVRYRSALEGKGDLSGFRELFAERLAVRLPAEISAGHSLIGPHRDDLEIQSEGRDLARFGSAGQQRSALLLLDLAQVSIYNSVYAENPVLLIDDIDAELDRGRIEALLNELDGRAQTFVSTSRRAIAKRYGDRARVFRVAGGEAILESSKSQQEQTLDSSDPAEESTVGIDVSGRGG